MWRRSRDRLGFEAAEMEVEIYEGWQWLTTQPRWHIQGTQTLRCFSGRTKSAVLTGRVVKATNNHTQIYILYITVKVVVAPGNTPSVGVGIFFKLSKRIQINKNSIIKKLKQIYQLMNIHEILLSFYTWCFIPSYMLRNRDIWMKCTNHPGGVIVSSCVWLPWRLQRLLAAWQCVSLKWRGRGWRCILVNSKGRVGALAALLPNAPRRLHH